MKKILITGISGFAGSYLAEYLLTRKDYTVFGIYHSHSVSPFDDQVEMRQLDLNDADKIDQVINEIQPDTIFHLAALTSAKESFKNPATTISNNIIIQLNILEAVRRNQLATRVMVISTSEIYGIVSKDHLPINEETPLNPVNPYAVSKIAQDYLGLQYHLAYKVDVVRLRPFVHIGPRQNERFVVSSFAKKIAEVEKGKRKPILTVGNLSAKRDFTDVRDMVRAYVMLMEKGKSGDVYNIGSGTSYSIKEILSKMLAMTTNKIEVQVDQALLRPIDIPELLCDTTKVKREIGWVPEIPLDVSLKDTLEYWRNVV